MILQGLQEGVRNVVEMWRTKKAGPSLNPAFSFCQLNIDLFFKLRPIYLSNTHTLAKNKEY